MKKRALVIIGFKRYNLRDKETGKWLANVFPPTTYTRIRAEARVLTGELLNWFPFMWREGWDAFEVEVHKPKRRVCRNRV